MPGLRRRPNGTDPSRGMHLSLIQYARTGGWFPSEHTRRESQAGGVRTRFEPARWSVNGPRRARGAPQGRQTPPQEEWGGPRELGHGPLPEGSRVASLLVWRVSTVAAGIADHRTGDPRGCSYLKTVAFTFPQRRACAFTRISRGRGSVLQHPPCPQRPA